MKNALFGQKIRVRVKNVRHFTNIRYIAIEILKSEICRNVCRSCRSRQELSNDYSHAKIGVGTAEEEPSKVRPACLPRTTPGSDEQPQARCSNALLLCSTGVTKIRGAYGRTPPSRRMASIRINSYC